MPSRKIKVATCQFPVSSSINRNSRYICDFLKQARRKKADLVHFPECALTGYAGFDLQSTDQIDWQLLRRETENILDLARQYQLWIILGSTHQLTRHQPHNSLYLINPRGQITDRYDKRFCTPDDLDNYSPGNRFVTFRVNGVKCALLICFDLRFPELYSELKRQKVDCIFQSFYNARQDGPSIHNFIMRQTMQCRAATNYFWISMTNSSARYAPYPSCFIRPDGKIVKQLPMNRPGLMTNTVNLNKTYYDLMATFRNAALKGALTNGQTIHDPRSQNTTCF
ncbi:MAG: carbon-nitrogen hydrolase family protein [Phycisphaerae bacterium]|nr:carbon-nitrogen hydrolase family protein [Phycisphaerae bacterium]